MYIDVSEDAPWDLRSLTFRDKVTSLAAPIRGKPKDQLAGDDLREQRRFRRLRRAAIIGLIVLTVLALAAAAVAVVQRQEAERQRGEAIDQRNHAIALRLISEGAAMLAGVGGDVRALQEILAAPRIVPAVDTGALLNAVTARRDMLKIIATPDIVHRVVFSPDGRRIVSGSDDGTLRIWPGPVVWPDLLCGKLTTNMSRQQWRDWVSPDIPYITVCPGLPVAPD